MCQLLPLPARTLGLCEAELHSHSHPLELLKKESLCVCVCVQCLYYVQENEVYITVLIVPQLVRPVMSRLVADEGRPDIELVTPLLLL